VQGVAKIKISMHFFIFLFFFHFFVGPIERGTCT
jgi:hypothetical protein